jgi:hypothetical protein
VTAKESTGKTVAICYITSAGKLYVRNAGDVNLNVFDMLHMRSLSI